MKILSIVLALSFFSFTHTTPSPDIVIAADAVEAELGRCAPEIMDISITFNDACDGFDWRVIICNNSKDCTTPAGTINVDIEYCPFQFDFLTLSYGSLPPQTCTYVSGTKSSSCSAACIVASFPGTTQSLTECEYC